MNSNEIKKEVREILDNCIADDLPIDKNEIYVDLITLISDIIDEVKEKGDE